jgi:uncharacterized protein
MLKVELRALELEDIVLEETGVPQALGIELTPEFSAHPLEIHCELSKGGDRVLARGWVKSEMRLTCDRCLKLFESPYKSFFEVHYRKRPEAVDPAGDQEFPSGDAETVFFQDDVLDISDQVRQTVLLSAPMRALCREDCKGLCPGCGADLNTETCGCEEPPPDDRWKALKKLKF